jgi:Bacterial Ig-like domain (group 2)
MSTGVTDATDAGASCHQSELSACPRNAPRADCLRANDLRATPRDWAQEWFRDAVAIPTHRGQPTRCPRARLTPGMTVPPTTTCPSCTSIVGDDDRACAHCGAAVSAFRPVSRTPLILPGNPALSADDTSTATPTTKGVGISMLGLAVVGVIAVFVTREPAPREVSAAESAELVSAQSESVVVRPTSAISKAADSVPRAADVAPVSAALPTVTAAQPTEVPAATMAAAPSSSAELGTEALVAAVNARTKATRKPAIPAPIAKPARDSVPAAPSAATAVALAIPAVAVPAAAVPAEKPAASIPVLHLVPLVSHNLHAGEIVRLRGTIQDMSSGRPLSTEIRFTSGDPRVARVDSRTGEVTGVAAGRVRIVVDGGTAGKQSVDLAVLDAPKRAAAPTTAVAVASAAPLRADSAAARSVTRSAVAPVAPQSASIAPQPLRNVERPNAADTRAAIERLASEVRSGSRRNSELAQFFADGASHKVSAADAPTTVETPNGVRATFELRVSKYDAGGRPITRFIPVQIDISKRDGEVNMSSVAIGALRRP